MATKLVGLWLAVVVLLAVLASLLGGGVSAWVWAGVGLGGGLGLLGLLGYTAASTRSARLLQRAALRLAAGDVDDAEAALVEVKRAFPRQARLLASQLEAAVAMRREDFDHALTVLDAGLAGPISGDERQRNVHLASRALRALLLLRAGKLVEARGEVEAVEAAAGDVEAMARGRVALVRAALAARTGDRAELVRAVRAGRGAMLGALVGRERILARALSAMASHGEPSAYRSPVHGRTDDEPLERWVASLVPQAVAYLREEPKSAALTVPELPAPSEAARVAVTTLHAHQATPRRERTLAIVVAVAAVAEGGVIAMVAGSAGAGALSVIGFLVLVAAGHFVHERQHWSALHHAVERLELGEHAAARAVMVPQTRASDGTRAAAANLYLGVTEYGVGNVPQALGHIERALELLAGVRARRGSPGDFPSLLSELARQHRALCLVALRRDDEAAAELECLDPRDTEATRFSAAALRAARDGELERVVALVASRPTDVPLGPREVILADVARVCAGRAAAQERGLIDAELAELPHLAAWLRGAVPSLWATYTGATLAARIGEEGAQAVRGER